MEGCTLGVWVAHGEGLFKFSSPALAAAIKDQELAPLRCAPPRPARCCCPILFIVHACGRK